MLPCACPCLPSPSDLGRICPGASDEPVKASDPGALGCLAANSSSLGALCRSELATLVRIHLNRWVGGVSQEGVGDGGGQALLGGPEPAVMFSGKG
jgi:hypothetical protein